MIKLCCSCGIEKPWDDFFLRRTGRPYAYCKQCNKQASNKWFRDHPEHKRNYQRVWRDCNPDVVKRYKAERRQWELAGDVTAQLW